MNTPAEINQAYQLGRFGKPWPQTYTREEWLDHTQKYPSAYRRTDVETTGNSFVVFFSVELKMTRDIRPKFEHSCW